MFETVYETIISDELESSGHKVQRQVSVPLIWKDCKLNHGFRTDLIIDNLLLIEVKSVESIDIVHKKQVLTYLKLTGLRLGLLINFIEAFM